MRSGVSAFVDSGRLKVLRLILSDSLEQDEQEIPNIILIVHLQESPKHTKLCSIS